MLCTNFYPPKLSKVYQNLPTIYAILFTSKEKYAKINLRGDKKWQVMLNLQENNYLTSCGS